MTDAPAHPALRPVARCRGLRDHHDRLLKDAIRSAFKTREGYTVDDIATAAGLSRQRIYQIANDAK
jgi:DNA-directed RNA polymerase sigma subunit (sigma70/sigma32)